MKLIFLLLTLSVSLMAQSPVPNPGGPIPIDDLKLLDQFERGMAILMQSEEFPKPAAVYRQLKAQTRPKAPLIREVARSETGLEPAEIYQKRLASVLLVGDVAPCEDCPVNHGDLAGGVAIATNLVLTAYHVLAPMKGSGVVGHGVMSRDGIVRPILGIPAADQDADLAVLRVGGPSLEPAPVSRLDRVGGEVTTISHPAGRYFMLTHGRIARFARYPIDDKTPRKGSLPIMEITADFAYGSSGGPVFNHRGEVCGIITATESIYFEVTRKRQNDLQMVIKACVPGSSIRRLLHLK